ncbi:MAG: dihydroflavonol-4-reductase [Sphingobacteriales bacterium]|jgi:dihydroflavonol-4-reductase
MILVTGATGFVGSHIVANLLSKGEEVLAAYRSEDKQENLNKLLAWKKIQNNEPEWIYCDLMDPVSLALAVQKASTVIHCAAMVSFKYKDKAALYDTNVIGTTNLINACLENEACPNFIFLSSTSSLNIPHLPKPENTNPVNTKEHYSFYGLTKFLGEMEVFRGQEEGLKVAVINPGVIVGEAPKESELQQLFSMAKRGFPWFSKALHGFTHINDVIAGIHILRKEWPRNVQHPIITENIRFQEIQNFISHLLNKRKPFWVLHKKFAWTLYTLGKAFYFIGLDLGLSRESIRTALHDSPITLAPIFTDHITSSKQRVFDGLSAHHDFNKDQG